MKNWLKLLLIFMGLVNANNEQFRNFFWFLKDENGYVDKPKFLEMTDILKQNNKWIVRPFDTESLSEPWVKLDNLWNEKCKSKTVQDRRGDPDYIPATNLNAFVQLASSENGHEYLSFCKFDDGFVLKHDEKADWQQTVIHYMKSDILYQELLTLLGHMTLDKLWESGLYVSKDKFYDRMIKLGLLFDA